MFASQLSHPGEVLVALLNGHIQIYFGQLFTKSACVELALNLAHACQLLFGAGRFSISQWSPFHLFSQSKYIVTSGSQVNALQESFADRSRNSHQILLKKVQLVRIIEWRRSHQTALTYPKPK
jgi:hypothetical protein